MQFCLSPKGSPYHHQNDFWGPQKACLADISCLVGTLNSAVWDRRYDAVAMRAVFFSLFAFQLPSRQFTPAAPRLRKYGPQCLELIRCLSRHPRRRSGSPGHGKGNSTCRAELACTNRENLDRRERVCGAVRSFAPDSEDPRAPGALPAGGSLVCSKGVEACATTGPTAGLRWGDGQGGGRGPVTVTPDDGIIGCATTGTSTLLPPHNSEFMLASAAPRSRAHAHARFAPPAAFSTTSPERLQLMHHSVFNWASRAYLSFAFRNENPASLAVRRRHERPPRLRNLGVLSPV
jgi:hypothetical protein